MPRLIPNNGTYAPLGAVSPLPRSGEFVPPRHEWITHSVAPFGASGEMNVVYKRAIRTEAITQVRTWTGNTAQTLATLCRIGVFEVNEATGVCTLVASTANDTTLWASTFTDYTRNLQATWNKVAGRLYASALIIVTAGNRPTFLGGADVGVSMAGFEFSVSDRLSGIHGSLADLPATYTDPTNLSPTRFRPAVRWMP